ncbi:hypothetical protein B0H10DRAFT_1951371 [Mycena sp. CBHHK59/15]|nr:hypothetical protein B0H10DRAFT_1951371 [Mycena sp. CBHHK59/15]
MNPKTHPSLTAAEPLLDLGTFKGGSPPEVCFRRILPSSQDAGRPAHGALDRLGSYLTLDPPDPRLNLPPPALARSARPPRRPYDDATAAHVARCISSCLEHLKGMLPLTDDFAWTTNAVQIGLLPVMPRCQTSVGNVRNGGAQDALVELLRLLSLYTLHPSLLRPLAVFLELEELVMDCSTLFDTDMNVSAGNPDVQNFRAAADASLPRTAPRIVKSNTGGQAIASTAKQQRLFDKIHHDASKHPLFRLTRESEGKEPPMSVEDYDFGGGFAQLHDGAHGRKGVPVSGSPSRFPSQGYVESQEHVSPPRHNRQNPLLVNGTVVERFIKKLEFAEPFHKICINYYRSGRDPILNCFLVFTSSSPSPPLPTSSPKPSSFSLRCGPLGARGGLEGGRRGERRQATKAKKVFGDTLEQVGNAKSVDTLRLPSYPRLLAVWVLWDCADAGPYSKHPVFQSRRWKMRRGPSPPWASDWGSPRGASLPASSEVVTSSSRVWRSKSIGGGKGTQGPSSSATTTPSLSPEALTASIDSSPGALSFVGVSVGTLTMAGRLTIGDSGVIEDIARMRLFRKRHLRFLARRIKAFVEANEKQWKAEHFLCIGRAASKVLSPTRLASWDLQERSRRGAMEKRGKVVKNTEEGEKRAPDTGLTILYSNFFLFFLRAKR